MNDTYNLPAELIDKYPVFEPNQVLASGHLNDMREFLQQQDRLTRARLIGTGVLYGFEMIQTDESIEITSGAGITTEGYLINIDPTEPRVFTKFKPYKMEETPYDPFLIGDNQIELFELLPNEMTGDNVKLIANYLSEIEKMVLVLYLEFKVKDSKTCFSTNCDDKGGKMLFTVRKLLVHETDAPRLFVKEIPVDIPQKGRLPLVRLETPVLNGIERNEILSSYMQVCSDRFIGNLASALRESYDHFDFFLSHEYNSINPFDDLETRLESLRNDHQDNIQYFYDFLVDVTAAYQEFRKITALVDYGTFTIDNDYPRHLLAGKLKDTGLVHRRTFRHHFESTTDYQERKESREKLVWYHNRIVLLIQNFSLTTGNIKITPSRENGLFGDRSIPFYYRPNSGNEHLYENWSYLAHLQEESDELLSYNSNEYNVDNGPILNPLDYNHNDCEFLRIEGHLGKTKKAAKTRINQLKKEKRLPFDLVVLSKSADSEETPGTGSDTSVALGYHDLQEDYYFHRLRLIHFVEDVKSLVFTLLESNSDDIKKGYRDVKDENDIFERIKRISERVDQLIKLLPPDLLKFDYTEFKDAYKQSLQDTVDFILIENNVLEEIYYELHYTKYDGGISFGDNVINQLVKLLFRIFDRLFYTRLLHIYTAFRARLPVTVTKTKKSSGSNSGPDLSLFTELHPGLTHLGGVFKGGTFVLVCDENDDSEVIADFSLPYLCCGSSGGSSSGSQLSFSASSIQNIKIAPFARPDYAIMAKGESVEINVMDNDYRLFESDLDITLEKKETKNGAKLEILEKVSTGEKVIIYNQSTDFVGVDRFKYKMTSKATGLSDEGTVAIYVRQNLLKANDVEVETQESSFIRIPVLKNDEYDREKPIDLRFRYNDNTQWVTTEKGENVEQLTTSLGASVQLFKPPNKDAFFLYMPAGIGTDEFLYRIDQDNAKSMARVRVIVTQDNLDQE